MLANVKQLQRRYDIRHLQRLPLGMSYVDVVYDIGVLLERPPLKGADLVVDATGPGRAVANIFEQNGLKPIKVTFTAWLDDEGTMTAGRFYTVSKSFLGSNLTARCTARRSGFRKPWMRRRC